MDLATASGVPCPDFSCFPVSWPQKGSPEILASNDYRGQETKVQGGTLWTTQTISCNPGKGTSDCVHWAQIDPSLVKPAPDQTAFPLQFTVKVVDLFASSRRVDEGIKDIYSLLDLLSLINYNNTMKATLTSKGQITIPARIRRKLGLQPGQVLDFDEDSPYLKAVLVFDEEAMRSVLGCAEGKLGMTTKEWLNETRGPVELPDTSS